MPVARWRIGCGAALLAGTVGCGAGGSGGQPTTGSHSPPARPSPARTVVRDHPTYRAGATGVVDSPREHASLRVTAGVPRVSTTRLSPGYGYAPARGHYVTFRITIVNTGRVPVAIRPLDFAVRTPGLGRTTTDDGNAPYSGGGQQLDNTELDAGQRISNDLTFDVARPRGTLLYAPGGRTALAWRF